MHLKLIFISIPHEHIHSNPSNLILKPFECIKFLTFKPNTWVIEVQLYQVKIQLNNGQMAEHRINQEEQVNFSQNSGSTMVPLIRADLKLKTKRGEMRKKATNQWMCSIKWISDDKFPTAT